MIYIGIDPGVHTGLAQYDTATKRLTFVQTVRIDEAIVFVRGLAATRDDILVFVEDARLRRWIPQEKDLAQFKGRAMGAGSVRRDCQIWQDFLTAYGIKYEMIPPHKGATKWTAETFALITGYTGRTSNHARDAALLVFGK